MNDYLLNNKKIIVFRYSHHSYFENTRYLYSKNLINPVKIPIKPVENNIE